MPLIEIQMSKSSYLLSYNLKCISRIFELQDGAWTHFLNDSVEPSTRSMLFHQLGQIQCSLLGIFRAFDIFSKGLGCWRMVPTVQNQPQHV